MQNSILNHPKLLRTKQKLKLTASRLVDHHVNLAVTGLSGSGKTAFITSLVNQLLEAKEDAQLPFFSVVAQSRLIGIKREVQPNLTFNRFAYEKAMANLSGETPEWPHSTTGISQVRLKIKYKKAKGLGQLLVDDSTLTLDITDYPGEWLLDLPLLDMGFVDWIKQCQIELSDKKRNELATEFYNAVTDLDFVAKADEIALQHIANLYTAYLKSCQMAGYQLLQPGRFILPGELADAPVLHFFPIPASIIEKQNIDLTQAPAGSNLEALLNRFEHYKEKVVKPFYKEHFKKFDRQLILVDCLSALNRGYDSFQDLQKAIDWLMGSFQYGSSSLMNRLFNPKIDKLVFAASKADHITPDQQNNLVKLLDNMLHTARKQIQYDGVETESTVISAIRASQSGLSDVNGESVPVLTGVDLKGEPLTMFPGDVPQHCPQKHFWQQQGFAYPRFSPPIFVGNHSLPHIRMDQVLEFLLADKLL